MFATSVLDVGIGLVLVFLSVSLVASAATEAIAALAGRRRAMLKRGVGRLLNDPGFTGLAGALYRHALVDPLGDGVTVGAGPERIPPAQFAIALADGLRRDAPGAALSAAVSRVGDASLAATLRALADAAGHDEARFRALVARWFAHAMAEVTDAYRRWTQAVAFGVALLVAVAANADALHVAGAIWAHTVLVSGAEVARLAAVPEGQDAGTRMMIRLGEASLLGWRGASFEPVRHPVAALLSVIGWLAVACSSLLGAPFWFDALQRLVRLRPEADPPPRPGDPGPVAPSRGAVPRAGTPRRR